MATVMFSNFQQLNSAEYRRSVQRIPEVSQCLREAQRHLDLKCGIEWDLMSSMASDHCAILEEEMGRKMLNGLVQIGLYRRYQRLHGVPAFVIGVKGELSPLNVCVGELKFEEFLDTCVEKLNQKSHLQLVSQDEELPILAGQRLKEYEVYKMFSGKIENLNLREMDVVKLIMQVTGKSGDHKLVHLGAGSLILNSSQEESLESSGIKVVDSIKEDPMLTWFQAS